MVYIIEPVHLYDSQKQRISMSALNTFYNLL